ncbi:CHAT domain-containing protein [Nostoc sp. FACHB-152]|uniref:CHAT domain-containing protein n=1 Tax=unclassified Nostoc TaxID=2593658 RepID=UPI001685345F|nr:MULTISPECIES: CHAT domain-containing protein [unclassified Nostoc]MBD2452466.1 CHAT domain-containing protein [Nostoc sp. FACHB-152]MBD2473395.1 CHAT domain-containing protein [Nostoc sp. FACHB-145]
MGVLGTLQYDPNKAQYYFEKALSQAQAIGAWDLAYQWQQKLGSLYKRQNKYAQALQMYEAAIKNLQQVRNNLLSTNADLQYSFYETVDPIYRDYMRLLLANSQNLSKVIKTHEQLQIAELENFLQCGKLELVELNQLKNLNTNYTVIHIIDLGSSIEVITQSPQQLLYHYSVDSKLVNDATESLLNVIQEPNFINTKKSVFLAYSQIIYNQLIAPIKKHISDSGTLVFNLDQSFQSIPMSLLYDGKDYLIQHYSITTTLGSRIRPPKFLTAKRQKALIAGISKPSPSLKYLNSSEDFQALPETNHELIDVKRQVQSSVALLNEAFTSQRFQQQLNSGNFPIVHVTTHGQFSSDPQQTVLLAWDKPINIREWKGWLKVQQNQDPIELLVLSACETAKGNKRSALGITGVAVQAGARSTVASLWLVDAKSTAMLVGQFYKGLNSGLTKAEALRQAQLSLLSNPQYDHPYYWAGLILVGSWL